MRVGLFGHLVAVVLASLAADMDAFGQQQLQWMIGTANWSEVVQPHDLLPKYRSNPQHDALSVRRCRLFQALLRLFSAFTTQYLTLLLGSEPLHSHTLGYATKISDRSESVDCSTFIRKCIDCCDSHKACISPVYELPKRTGSSI